MRFFVVFSVVLCVSRQFASASLSDEETAEITDSCCQHGESFAVTASAVQQCNDAEPPDDIESDQTLTCLAALRSCCVEYFKLKDECSAGLTYASAKRCAVPKTDTAKTCCEECSIGTLTGESQGIDACGGPAGEYDSPNSALRKNAYHKCCVEAAVKPTTTTPPPKTTTSTRRPTTTPKPKEKCRSNSCDHKCNDDHGKIHCSCNEGYRLQSDKRSCKDINECAEALDDLCTAEGTVCHNVPGSFKCVPLKKRDVSMSCPPGFKKNVQNQVCDDINECQSPRPPCPKYLCENTIGGYKCNGKPGKPYEEDTPGKVIETPEVIPPPVKNDICPPGFRSGPDDECIDIDECKERSDDCQRLSQYCINTHGHFFCQDHVSKRCAPGFVINKATGVCEDINECEASEEVCQRNEVCINMPGAYSCKSKTASLPELGRTDKGACQEGTRPRQSGTGCEDIDECVEGSHLCDQFQNCINTYGGHECRCKTGFTLDSSGSCVDVDECALKMDDCREGTYCLNVVGTFTCTKRPATTSTTLAPPGDYEYYYDSEEDNATAENETNNEVPPPGVPGSYPSTPNEVAPPPPPLPPKPSAPQTPFSTPKPTPAITTTTPRPTTTKPPTRRPYIPRTTSTTRRPYTNPPRPRQTQRPESPRPEPGNTDAYDPRIPVSEPPVIPRRTYVTYTTTTRTTRPVTPMEVIVPTPTNVNTIEKEKDKEGSYGIDTSDVPKDRWTNVIGKDKPEMPRENDFHPNDLHCLHGYERNYQGVCVDINECEGRHICSALEVCENRPGGYICNCQPGYRRDQTGWCVLDNPTTTARTTTSTTIAPTPPAPPPLPPRPEPQRPEPERPYSPMPRERPRPTNCELGYTYDYNMDRCVDIDECATGRANCSPEETCVNVDGGFRCVCGRRCRPDPTNPSYVTPSREPVDSTVITVGSQYGQRGPKYVRATVRRQPDVGAIISSCPWGYQLTKDRMCVDVDECGQQVSECGAEQRCENFYGGYMCQCPAGHRLKGQTGCEDIDECRYGQQCPYNSQCVNTIGSFRCACDSGFRNAPANERVCVDIDECAESPALCEQGCANAWGGYRCYCQKGYKLASDNRTCVDIDECGEWAARGRARGRGRLCGGECVNTPGSYRCECPHGYRLSQDGRSCIDIDECETGVATCARAPAGEVCQNTRGGYHCHRIACPQGYRLEDKHRCSRIQRSCPIGDWGCLHQPSSYSYNFITFVANIYLPEGSVDLFTMHGPAWVDAVVTFEMRMTSVRAPPGVRPVDLACFDMRPSNNICVVSLLCSPEGPQVAELELTMSLYQRGQFAGSAVARLVVIVSQYEF